MSTPQSNLKNRIFHKSQKTQHIEAKINELADPGREALSNGTVGAPSAHSAARGADSKPEDHPSAAYGYDRDRHHAPPPAVAERYRDPPPGEYGRAPYSTFEGRGGSGSGSSSMGRGESGSGARDSDPRDLRDHPPVYDKPRDPRDPYYSSPTSYPAIPPPASEYRGRDPYPPRAAQPPLDYTRGPAPPPLPATYDERYPRGSPMDLESPIRGREGYRDLPPRQLEYGHKRKYDGPEYIDPYVDDYRVLFFYEPQTNFRLVTLGTRIVLSIILGLRMIMMTVIRNEFAVLLPLILVILHTLDLPSMTVVQLLAPMTLFLRDRHRQIIIVASFVVWNAPVLMVGTFWLKPRLPRTSQNPGKL